MRIIKKQTLCTNMLSTFQCSVMKELLHLHPQHGNQFLPSKTTSDSILSRQHCPATDQADAYHTQAGLLMTTVCRKPKTIHSTQSVCYLCSEEIHGVYSSNNSLHNDITASAETMDYFIAPSSSVSADGLRTKSDKFQRNPHCKCANMKHYSILDEYIAKTKEDGQWRKEAAQDNKPDKQSIKKGTVGDHKVCSTSVREVESVLTNMEIEGENGGTIIIKDTPSISKIEKVYQSKEEVGKMLDNTNITVNDHYSVASEPFISRDDHIYSSHIYSSNRSIETTQNTYSCFRLRQLKLEMITKEHDILKEIVSMFNNIQDKYNVLDGNVINAFKNYFSSVEMFISANKNKSGNSGYNIEQNFPRAGNARKRKKKHDLTMYVDADNRSQRLQSCLEKSRLACTLRGTIGHMRNRTDHYAAVMAYEQSIKDLETSMKIFLELNAENTSKDTLISGCRPLVVDYSQKMAYEGAKHQLGQNALRKSETFVIEDPRTYTVSHAPKLKRGTRDVCIQKVYCPPGKICLSENDTVRDDETFIFSSDSTQSLSFLPDPLSSDILSDFSSRSQNKSHFSRSKVCKAKKQSNFDSRKATSEEKCVSKNRYGNKSQDSDLDTFECLSSTEETGKQVNRFCDLTVSPKKPHIDKISESGNKQTNLKHRFSYVNIKDSTFPDFGIPNNEQEENDRPKHSIGNTYLCKRLPLSKVVARSQSFHNGDIISENPKAGTKLNISSNDGEIKKQIHRMKSKSGVCLPIYAYFNSVNNIMTENSHHNRKHKIIQQPLSLQPKTQNHVAGTDIQDSAIINTRKMPRYSALCKNVSGSAGKHAMYSNLKELRADKNDKWKLEYRTSTPEQAGFEKISENKCCLFSGSSFGPMKSSQYSSPHLKVATHKKWRLPKASKKTTLLRYCSDKCPSMTSGSGSYNDSIDNLQVGLSTSDLRYQQQANVSTNLHELNTHVPRRNKIRTTLLKKKTSTDIPSWVYNAEKDNIINNKCLILNTKEGISGVKYGGLEGAHAVYQSGRFFTKRDKTLADQGESTHFSPKEIQRPQELVVAINKDDVLNLHKHIHSRDEKSLDAVDNENCKTTTYDWWNTIKDKNNAKPNDTLTNMIGKIPEASLSQEGNAATCSTLSNRSFEKVLPESQSCQEGTSESGFKSDKYENKLSLSAGCSKSVSQSHEAGIVSEFTCLAHTSSRFEEAGDLNLYGLSSNIVADTNINTGYSSCSLENHISEFISALVFSKSSSGNLERDVDNDILAYSNKMNATEQQVREISESQPNLVQLPYPFCFVSLKDDKQFVYQSKEDLPNDQNRPEVIKHQKDEISVACHHGETEAETIKIYSVRSPPKGLPSNKQVNYSPYLQIDNLSVNPDILKDKEVRCPSEADDKETFPFAYIGKGFDSFSPSENYFIDFVDSAKKEKATQVVNVDSSDDLQFNGGSKSSFLIHEEKRAVKHSQEISASKFNMPVSTTTNCQHTDLLTRSSQITQDRRRCRSTLGKQSLHLDLMASQDNRSPNPGWQKENAIIKHLRNKVKYMEAMLELRHFPDFSFECKKKYIDNTEDPVLSKDPRYLQCVVTQSLVHARLPSTMNHASMMHHSSPRPTCEPRNHEQPESCHLLTECRCVQHAGSLCPLGHHWAESKFIGRREAPLCISTGCQTTENYERTHDSRLHPCTLVDNSTQCDTDLPEEGDSGTNKLLKVQMTQIHADVQAIKNNVLTRPHQSLHELMSDQKKELGDINSKLEVIALSLQESKDALTKKGVEYDKMKERISDLTSQRDAEKVFHKITRQAFWSLERDHDRLRQQFFHATCRRFKHGKSLVQKRVWYHLNGDDTTCHRNISNSPQDTLQRRTSHQSVIDAKETTDNVQATTAIRQTPTK